MNTEQWTISKFVNGHQLNWYQCYQWILIKSHQKTTCSKYVIGQCEPRTSSVCCKESRPVRRLSWQTYSPASESRNDEISKRLTPPAVDTSSFSDDKKKKRDTGSIWSNFVLFHMYNVCTYIKIGHCPIVRLSIVMRVVSQCSVIINHASLFVTVCTSNSFMPPVALIS